MTLLRRALIPLVAIVALAAGGVAWTAASASSATASTYSLTVAGTDMHALDPHVEPIFVNGGGVEAITESSTGTAITYRYLEVQLALPVGARITSVSVTSKHCSPKESNVFTFGSYSPTTRNTMQYFNLTGTSCTIGTLTKSGNPITTTVAGRRYVLDFSAAWLTLYPGSDEDVFYGATIKYTCTNPCVP